MFRCLSSVIAFPHATDVAFTSAVANRVAGAIGTLDPDVPACASVPHCDLRVADVRLVSDGDSLDDVLHVFHLCCCVVVSHGPIIYILSTFYNPNRHPKFYFVKVVVTYCHART